MDVVCSRPTSNIARFPWLTLLFVAVVLFFSYHDFYYSKRGNDTFNLSEDELMAHVVGGPLGRRMALMSLGLFAIVSLFRYREARFRIHSFLGWSILFFAGWAVLSVAWAEDVALTSRRLVVFIILCIAAVVIVRRCSLREIVLLIFFWNIIFLIIGVSAEISLGTFQPFTTGYRFAGTLHPNSQGINCALLLLSGVTAADTDKQNRILFRVFALLGFVFLVLTGSRTSFVAGMLSLAVYFVAVCCWRAKLSLGLILGIVFCLFLLIAQDASKSAIQNAALLGRDNPSFTSFNGRTSIWRNCFYYIENRPIIGYGFGGFWTQRNIAEISSVEQWGVASSHSAYLECLLNLGLVGLAFYVFALLSGIAKAFSIYRVTQAPVFAFSAAFLLFFVLDGLLESIVIGVTPPMFFGMIVLTWLAFVPCKGKA